jgi:hypothetical protein
VESGRPSVEKSSSHTRLYPAGTPDELDEDELLEDEEEDEDDDELWLPPPVLTPPPPPPPQADNALALRAMNATAPMIPCLCMSPPYFTVTIRL